MVKESIRLTENGKTISDEKEVAEILNLIDKNTGKTMTHTIRFWEKQFKQIRPKIFSGKRRYYDDNSIEILKKIKFLLKEKGMTIKGVKSALNSSDTAIDETKNLSIKKRNLKLKLEKISDLIKNLKN